MKYLKWFLVYALVFLSMIITAAICVKLRVPKYLCLIILILQGAFIIRVMFTRAERYFNRGMRRIGLLNTLMQKDSPREDYKKAIGYFEKAIKLDPNYFQAYLNNGYANIKINNYEEALANIKKAEQLKPDNFYCNLNASACEIHLRKFESARKYLNRLMESNPENPMVNINYAILEMNLLNFEDSKKYLETAKKHNNKKALDLAIETTYSELETKSENLEKAKEHLRNVFKMDKNYSRMYNNLGVINYKLGKFNIAKGSFKRALKLNPYLGESYFYLGKIEKIEENDKKSEEYFAKAKELNYNFDI